MADGPSFCSPLDIRDVDISNFDAFVYHAEVKGWVGYGSAYLQDGATVSVVVSVHIGCTPWRGVYIFTRLVCVCLSVFPSRGCCGRRGEVWRMT